MVWKKSHNLTLSIYQITKNSPPEEKFGLTAQIRRSSSSICANIVEGYKKSSGEFLRYLNISEASLEETKYHLILSRDLEYLDGGDFEKMYALSEEIGKMLNRLIAGIKYKKAF